MNTMTLGESLEALATAVLDARKAFGPAAQLHMRYSLHMRPWPNGNCGYDRAGPVGHVRAPCVVVEHRSKARVYHAGEFAYQVDNPSEKFREDLRHHRLMGKAKFESGDGLQYMKL